MASIGESGRLSIRGEAERFLSEHGFLTPPLPPEQALAARKLEVAQLSLDELLVKANLPEEDHSRIQAMLNVSERAVLFKRGLPYQKKNWGALHEIGHEFIPWQRELLYHCPLIWLPPSIQAQFEQEADIFAAEAFFFGKQFRKQALEGDFSLNTAIELATTVYQTSIHATFVHLVEESPLPQCLLIWKHYKAGDTEATTEQLKLHYYVKSKSFHYRISTGQIADPEGVVAKLYESSGKGVIKHELTVNNGTGKEFVAQAESFSNSYSVFTLMSQPVPIVQNRFAPVGNGWTSNTLHPG